MHKASSKRALSLRASSTWMALVGLLACGDGTIGTESCIGARCDAVTFLVEPLVVNFQDVSTGDPSPLPPPTWSIANPCAGACAQDERAVLYPAPGEQSWNLVRAAPVPTLELINGDGTRVAQTLVKPAGATGGFGKFVSAQSDGSLLVHAQWAGMSTDIDELTTLSSSVPPRNSTLRPLAQKRPLGAIAGEAGGFLLFDANLITGPLTGSVRLVGTDGSVVWQRAGFNSEVAVIGGSAVWNSAQYVVAARNTSAPATSAYSLVWLNPGGQPQRATRIFGSNWRGAQLFDRGNGQFVAVGPTDLEAGVGAGGENEGFIDIVEFNFENVVRGFRITRECLFKLQLNGFAVDRSGTMFVSSMVGTREQPRGLLCKLPTYNSPKCYQTEPNQVLGALVAINSNSVVAVLDQQIVRFDLP